MPGISASVNSLNTGHGHVRPRPDGAKARCGGPGLCRVCQQEKAALAPTPGPIIPGGGIVTIGGVVAI